MWLSSPPIPSPSYQQKAAVQLPRSSGLRRPSSCWWMDTLHGAQLWLPEYSALTVSPWMSRTLVSGLRGGSVLDSVVPVILVKFFSAVQAPADTWFQWGSAVVGTDLKWLESTAPIFSTDICCLHLPLWVASTCWFPGNYYGPSGTHCFLNETSAYPVFFPLNVSFTPFALSFIVRRLILFIAFNGAWHIVVTQYIFI